MHKRSILYLIIIVLLSGSHLAWGALHYERKSNSDDINDAELVITNPTCRSKDGSIKGLQGPAGSTYEWRDKDGNKIGGNSIDLVNIPYGAYTLLYTSAAGFTKKYGPLLVHNTTGPKLDQTKAVITAGSCSNNGGSIKGIIAESDKPLVYRWVRMANQEQVGDQLDLVDVPPGRYRLQISDPDVCDYIRSSVITIPGTGVIDVDLTQVNIANAQCGQATGSITGIILKNPDPQQVIIWTNSEQKIVGNTIELSNVKPGFYTLTIQYANGSCPFMSSPFEVVNQGGPVINAGNVVIDRPFCGDRHGSITGLTATGLGSLTYVWYNTEGKEVGRGADLYDIGARTFRVVVTDESGCGSTTSPWFVVNNDAPGFPFDERSAIVVKATCTTKGSVTGIKPNPFLNYSWDNGLNVISKQLDLVDVTGGEYTLTVTAPCADDPKYVQVNYYKFDLGPKEASFKDFEISTVASCTGEANGAITINSDYTVRGIRWVNAGNEDVGHDKTVTGLPAGTYKLFLSNDYCEVFYRDVTITTANPPLPPVAEDVQLCSGTGIVRVSGADAGSKYRLYEDETNTYPIDEQENGMFNINVKNNRSYYISTVTGSCESKRSDVNVRVGIPPADIASAITPNNDGFNDFWTIKNIEKFPAAIIKVFDRYGHNVFSSTGYAKPFNGTLNGKVLPAGAYYFIISLTSTCNVSGNLTLIR